MGSSDCGKEMKMDNKDEIRCKMKLKDKLAVEYVTSKAPPYKNLDVLDAYIGGFEKALELARDIVSDSGSDPTGFIYRALSEVGEV